MARLKKNVVLMVGVVRSPYAQPGQEVSLDMNYPMVEHYLKVGVLALVAEPEPSIESEFVPDEVAVVSDGTPD